MWGGRLPASQPSWAPVGDLRVNDDKPGSDETRRRFFPSPLILGQEGPGNNRTRRKIADP